MWSGTVVTGGDLVFYGTMDGWFKAANARTGEIVWKYKVDSGIISQPISYKGPDGHQYIAVLSGVGGWSGAVVSGPVDPRDGSAALGMINGMLNQQAAVLAYMDVFELCAVIAFLAVPVTFLFRPTKAGGRR